MKSIENKLANIGKKIDRASIVMPSDEAFKRYHHATAPKSALPLAAIKPNCENDVIKITKWAYEHNISLHPISTGQNWGYGDSSAVIKDYVVVDFSCMNRIIEMDESLGLVTIQPGVTQDQLYTYLQSKNSIYMTPTTGAGPSCSLVGNALERGFGLNGIQDHFSAVHAIKGVFPTGEKYESAMCAIAPKHKPVFKWHTGPYMDGVFAQGNTLIVTEMTLALDIKNENKSIFIAEFKSQDDFLTSIIHIQKIFLEFGKLIGSIQMSDKLRILSMGHPYPEGLKENETIKQEVINRIAKEQNIADWTIYFTVGGNPHIKKAVLKECKKRLRQKAKITTLSENFLRFAYKYAPKKLMKKSFMSRLRSLMGLFDILNGKPSEVSLPLAYWKSNRHPPQKNLNPARDNCGLVWFAPIVPLIKKDIDKSLQLIRSICRDYGFEPTVSSTCLTPRSVECTVPILYNKDTESQKVQECYKKLFEACRKEGYLPYRYPNFFMHELTQTGNTYWNTVQKVKNTLDPKHIITPGRYSKLESNK